MVAGAELAHVLDHPGEGSLKLAHIVPQQGQLRVEASLRLSELFPHGGDPILQRSEAILDRSLPLSPRQRFGRRRMAIRLVESVAVGMDEGPNVVSVRHLDFL